MPEVGSGDGAIGFHKAPEALPGVQGDPALSSSISQAHLHQPLQVNAV